MSVICQNWRLRRGIGSQSTICSIRTFRSQNFSLTPFPFFLLLSISVSSMKVSEMPPKELLPQAKKSFVLSSEQSLMLQAKVDSST